MISWGMVGLGLVGLIGSSWFGLWYAIGANPVGMVPSFGYWWDSCELVDLG
jgi:hypothetical protein